MPHIQDVIAGRYVDDEEFEATLREMSELGSKHQCNQPLRPRDVIHPKYGWTQQELDDMAA